MAKKAVSVTLSPENLLWLRAQAVARGKKSVSETLDQLLEQARTGETVKSASQSVRGMIRIAPSDQELREADREIRAQFRRSLESFDTGTDARRRPKRRPKTKRKG